jgi:hypothetical protein
MSISETLGACAISGEGTATSDGTLPLASGTSVTTHASSTRAVEGAVEKTGQAVKEVVEKTKSGAKAVARKTGQVVRDVGEKIEGVGSTK